MYCRTLKYVKYLRIFLTIKNKKVPLEKISLDIKLHLKDRSKRLNLFYLDYRLTI